MTTSNDIRTSRVYVKPGVSICNLVSYRRDMRVHALLEGEDKSSPSVAL